MSKLPGDPGLDALRTVRAARHQVEAARRVALVVMDREAFEQGLFKSSGGFARCDKVFDGKLADVLGEAGDASWQDVG